MDDAVDEPDWLCAAINALMVSGEILDQPGALGPDAAPVVVPLVPRKSNGLVAPWVAPWEDVVD